MFENAPHCHQAWLYANHCVKGHKLACKWEQLATQRFLDDLDRDFPYNFDAKLAESACKFIELLPHVKGKWARDRLTLELEPWQCFIICNLFGWIDGEGLRRFREAYLKVARKNGKSNLMAAIGLYVLASERKDGPEIYSGATTERQAMYVFDPARSMCLKTPALTEHYGISVAAKNINILKSSAKFEPVVGDPGDGSNPAVAVIDEYHEHTDDTLVETMRTGMGSREQPLLLMITTAGDNHGGPCYAAEIEYQQILERVAIDESMFSIMYGIDAGDDWTSEDALIKANPNLDVSVFSNTLKTEQAQAIRLPRKQNAFKRKHLNMWVGAAVSWLNMESWKKCEDVTLDEDAFKDEVCIFGLDLSSKLDLTAFARVYVKSIEGVTHYYAFCDFYLPDETIFEASNKMYEGWHTEEYIKATQGAEIDLNEIQDDVSEWMRKVNPKELAYDQWHATQLAQNLTADGMTCVEYRPTRANMNECMKELEAAIESRRFHHNGNPVLTWCVSNVLAKTDYQDNIFPVKADLKTGNKKIDGALAVLMAVGRAMYAEEGIEYDVIFA
ncbi:MAG: terminase large subunit [Gammaproteobacteria bacterium]|nr:terminase large subunit [Gammaproteobacteria bacterium]